ncbi:hypothetical protein GGTG_09672 [Gaeumannomyces tritici R3-111a-1]|uniref:Uncharacterized protein n=1 Tax=Gaeumannomyces tritici (strain R3-111a-1) TaxID=644352 RepID=J3P834_GAET3|nr:hypothetical protein GGTG_09672 [Gaeumannomyces tritici R3-111a-1]EJT72817.1 hypothetical protein GGTG_09672 [Gaeumannomyces tritici R3-111a-1]
MVHWWVVQDAMEIGSRNPLRETSIGNAGGQGGRQKKEDGARTWDGNMMTTTKDGSRKLMRARARYVDANLTSDRQDTRLRWRWCCVNRRVHVDESLPLSETEEPFVDRSASPRKVDEMTWST